MTLNVYGRKCQSYVENPLQESHVRRTESLIIAADGKIESSLYARVLAPVFVMVDLGMGLCHFALVRLQKSLLYLQIFPKTVESGVINVDEIMAYSPYAAKPQSLQEVGFAAASDMERKCASQLLLSLTFMPKSHSMTALS